VIGSCQIKGRFRACGKPGIAVCQYCGRSFCEAHGTRLDDEQEICVRETCQAKKADVERFAVYKTEVVARNEQRLCGDPACALAPGGQCSKCQGLFCLDHLSEREIDQWQGGQMARVRGVLCPHCLRRRSLWERR
jgi:hypothetical protein